MNVYARLGIVAALLVVIGVTLAMKQKDKTLHGTSAADTPQAAPASGEQPIADASVADAGSTDAAGDVARDTLAVMTATPQENETTRLADGAGVTRATAKEEPPAKAALPRLVDLGAGKCVACKQMAPILENLKKEYAGRMTVEFIDVWENPKAAEEYGIRMIPTQIFFDAAGKERFRHEGFYSKEDILGKWKELDVDVESKPVAKG